MARFIGDRHDELWVKGGRQQVLGVLLLIVAGLLWAWCLSMLYLPFEVDRARYGGTLECAAPLRDDSGSRSETCAAARRWADLVLMAGAATVTSLVGLAVFLSGRIKRLVSEPLSTLVRLRGRPE